MKNWVEIGLIKYWKEKAQELTFQDFLFDYVELMIIRNREAYKFLAQCLGMKENATIDKVYLKLRKLA